jgi:hypothetical protein
MECRTDAYAMDALTTDNFSIWPLQFSKQEPAIRSKARIAPGAAISPRSRPDYERIMQMICDTPDKHGTRIGERMTNSVSPRAASKIYKGLSSALRGNVCGKARKSSDSAALSHLPKIGVPMIMRKVEKGEAKCTAKVWSCPGMEKLVQQLRRKIVGVQPLLVAMRA